MVFLSHSWHNKPAARRLVEALSRERIPCWLDDQQLDYGREIRASLRNAISDSDIYLYLVSTAANDSKWVKDELDHALNLEFESRLRIVPVRLADSDDPMPDPLMGRKYAHLDPSHGGAARLAQSLAGVKGCDRIPDDNRLSATVRLEEHGIAHTLVQARDFATDSEEHVLLLDSGYESLDELYWQVSDATFPLVESTPGESTDIAEIVDSVHRQCRNIIKEARSVCRRFIDTDGSRADVRHYVDAGHERILYEMLHRLKWNTTYLRHLRGDEAFDEALKHPRNLAEPFDGRACDIIYEGKKLGSVNAPRYASKDLSTLFGHTDVPFTYIFPWDVGKAVGHVLARRFMAGNLRSTEVPDPGTLTCGLS